MKLKLILADGTEFIGDSFGYHPTEESCLGEVVFNTSMTGYQEILSDPSYCDQMVVMTYPLIGNYGVNRDDFESLTPALKALIVREHCEEPNNWRNETKLSELLTHFKIPAIQGIDTRQLTRIIRMHGSMKAIIVSEKTDKSKYKELLAQNLGNDQIARVSTQKPAHHPGDGHRIVLVDYGYKKNILKSLLKRKCDVIVVPYNTSFEEITRYHPDGILLSNGPGDPKDIPETLETIRKIQERYPLFCICMGHQVFALANGADTEKMKFGHRGANHPVLDLKTEKVFITSQNHGYAVKSESIAKTHLEITQINLNDKTVEGLKHKKYPAFSVQYHPEANPGPDDTHWLFDEFLESVFKNEVARAKV
ncbi:MAG: glutamine-hydrolyzing carbamoyl-phosphate synthase small subunit [Bacteriovoracaceae bacterium]|nr:glutamine-hydrolyzing carbamoyl-phosphate synthase small subunit [Bacteriovoracaceae bacterium]